MKKKLLIITAHPDDESFGPGGTIAYYAKQGVEVHVICATRGEAGEDFEVQSPKFPSTKLGTSKVQSKKRELHTVREEELLEAAKVLGVAQVDFLDFIDGTLNNQQYHLVAEKILAKFESFKPHVVLTHEPRGGSGHLDHIALSFITTYAYFKSNIPKKLYYHCLPVEYVKEVINQIKEYFVYFPPGYSQDEITTRVDVSSVWGVRLNAIRKHKSQWYDARRILARLEKLEIRVEYFILRDSRINTTIPEKDLFEGIGC